MKTSSSLYSEASGPIGSVEFSRTAAGVTLRNKPVYKAPQTRQQVENRSNVASAAVAWTGMTPEARESYRLAALRVPQVGKFGRVFYLSGWNFFCKRWITFAILFGVSSDLLTNPIDLTLPYSPGPFLFEYVRDDGNNSILLTNNNSDYVFFLYSFSGLYSAFRTETPIYRFGFAGGIASGSTYRITSNNPAPGRYYIKISVINLNFTWSTTVFNTYDIA